VKRLRAAVTVCRFSVVEVLVVDDGSPPEEQEALHAALARAAGEGSEFTPVLDLTAVCLSENRGQPEATVIGVGLARGGLVATVDDDGGHPVEELPAMVSRLTQDPRLDVVYGAPIGRSGISMFRRLGTVCNNLLFTLFARKPWRVPVTSFRVIRRERVQAALAVPMSYPYLSAMLFASVPPPKVGVHRYPAPPATPSRYVPRRLLQVYWRLVLYWGPLRVLGRRLRPRRIYDVAGGCR
jgi:glycosyltransferase involved in cell wall biosynthesis